MFQTFPFLAPYPCSSGLIRGKNGFFNQKFCTQKKACNNQPQKGVGQRFMRPNIKLPHRFKDDHRCRTKPGMSQFPHLRSSPNLRGENGACDPHALDFSLPSRAKTSQKTAYSRLFPPVPASWTGGRGGSIWLNSPTSTQPNPTESREVKADRCSKKSELPERSMVLHGIYCRSLNAEQRTPKAPEGKSEYLGISRIFPSFG